jgi:hypothetical protein
MVQGGIKVYFRDKLFIHSEGVQFNGTELGRGIGLIPKEALREGLWKKSPARTAPEAKAMIRYSTKRKRNRAVKISCKGVSFLRNFIARDFWPPP